MVLDGSEELQRETLQTGKSEVGSLNSLLHSLLHSLLKNLDLLYEPSRFIKISFGNVLRVRLGAQPSTLDP